MANSVAVAKYKKKRYDNAKKEGICCCCFSAPSSQGRVQCQACIDKHKGYTTSLRDHHRKEGKCLRCGCNEPMEYRQLCLICWAKGYEKRFGINHKNALKKLADQDYKCFYTGKELVPGFNASLDHTNPLSRGGENGESNLQWVDWHVNMCKRDSTHNEFVEMCRSVAAIHKET